MKEIEIYKNVNNSRGQPFSEEGIVKKKKDVIEPIQRLDPKKK